MSADERIPAGGFLRALKFVAIGCLFGLTVWRLYLAYLAFGVAVGLFTPASPGRAVVVFLAPVAVFGLMNVVVLAGMIREPRQVQGPVV